MVTRTSPASIGRTFLPILLVFLLFPTTVFAQDDDCVTNNDCEDRLDGRTLCDNIVVKGTGLETAGYKSTFKCIALPSIPVVPEFGYFSEILNRSFVRNFTKYNVSIGREGLDGSVPKFRDCFDYERDEAGCMQNSKALCTYDVLRGVPKCLCRADHYGNGVKSCEPCPSGLARLARDEKNSWFSSAPEGSTSHMDCRTHWLSHVDTITLANEVITIKLDQNGLRSSIYNDVSPKWNAQTGIAGYGKDEHGGGGSVAQRQLHECRDSAMGSNTVDSLSSHCRHLVGIATGNGNEEGSGRVFRYTTDEFMVVVKLDGTPHQTVLAPSALALEGFTWEGIGEDCGHGSGEQFVGTHGKVPRDWHAGSTPHFGEKCGGTKATYVYSTRQPLTMPHHKLRHSNAQRGDVKGPRGFVRSTHRPYSTSPSRPRGLGGAQPVLPAEEEAAEQVVLVKVVYQLLRGEEFPTKMVQLVSDRDVDIVETKPYHVLNGCQVQRPSDSCPYQSGTGR